MSSQSKPSQSPSKVDSGAAGLVGRTEELSAIRMCLKVKKNLLLEGPVGVGKTFLALAAIQELGKPVFRIDGDHRYSEQKLSGWFDPPSVIKYGFSAESFINGPLLEAMKSGGVLFINELNRLPEGVQNVLLPAVDEKIVMVPRLGEVRAKDGFVVIATQNPKEFVGTSHLSEALLDRFEFIYLDYQTEAEELEIVNKRLGLIQADVGTSGSLLPLAAVNLVRLTRNHPKIRRGASVRAALSIADLAFPEIKQIQPHEFAEHFLSAVLLALPTRIEMERSGENGLSARAELNALIRDLVQQVVAGLEQTGASSETKKKLL